MATEIKIWEVKNGKLSTIDSTSMSKEGRREKEDLETWIKTDPSILGEGILLFGEQVQTKSGPLDFLGIDKEGNILVIELKRDKLPRDVLAQAIDYASDVATYTLDKLNEICKDYTKEKNLEELFMENFEEGDLEAISINQSQRILIVGTGTEESLERMIEWLSEHYGVDINAVLFSYVKTSKGEELLARTMILPEEVVTERSRRHFKIPMSDRAGDYDEDELAEKLKKYFSSRRRVHMLIRDILLPLCLKHEKVTRELIIEELENKDPEIKRKEKRPGTVLSTISREIGYDKRDYLRQIIKFDRVEGAEHIKDNFRIEPRYHNLVENILETRNK